MPVSRLIQPTARSRPSRAAAAAVALSVAVLGFTLPAAAHASPDAPTANITTAVESPAAQLPAAGQLTANITSSGLPGPVVSGTTATIDVSVDSPVLGSPEATGLIMLAANGDLLSARELVDGKATFAFRPLASGEDFQMSIVYAGNDVYEDSVLELGVLDVRAATANLLLEIPEPPAYGGGALTAYVTVTSDDSALYGDPHGYVVLTRDGQEVGRANIAGSNDGPRGFADPSEDLGSAAPESLAIFNLKNPDILPGSPDSADFRAHFHPTNWFTEAGHMPYTVPVAAAPTKVELLPGDIVEPVTSVAGPTRLYAYIHADDGVGGVAAAEPSGTVRFLANGELIGESAALEANTAFIDWTPTTSGPVVVGAEFVPDTLNHLASVAETTVRVTLPLVPDEAEKPSPKPTKQAAPAVPGKKSTTELARTGAQAPLLLGGSAALVLLGGLAFVAARRRDKATHH